MDAFSTPIPYLKAILQLVWWCMMAIIVGLYILIFEHLRLTGPPLKAKFVTLISNKSRKSTRTKTRSLFGQNPSKYAEPKACTSPSLARTAPKNPLRPRNVFGNKGAQMSWVNEMSTSQQVMWLWLDPNWTLGEMWWKWRTNKAWSTVVGR